MKNRKMKYAISPNIKNNSATRRYVLRTRFSCGDGKETNIVETVCDMAARKEVPEGKQKVYLIICRYKWYSHKNHVTGIC